MTSQLIFKIFDVAKGSCNFLISPTGKTELIDFGTGKIWYTNAGYVLPHTLTGENILLQPFAAVTYKDFEGLSESSWQYDLGLSYYIYGPYVKLSTMYSSRPVYTGTIGSEGQNKVSEHKGNLIIQLQFCL